MALVLRVTRITAHLEVLHFKDGLVTEVKLPDYRANILNRKPSKKCGLFSWVSKPQWEESKLTFRIAGQRSDGSGDPAFDPGNWYHIEAIFKAGAKQGPHVARLLALKPVDAPVRIS